MQNTIKIKPITFHFFHYMVSALMILACLAYSVSEEKLSLVSVLVDVPFNKWWTESLLFLPFGEKKEIEF